MKRFFFITLSLTFLFAIFPKSVRAQNKVGVNIGDHWAEFGQAADLVGPGGWIVVMACPGDGDKIAENVSKYPNINLVIRGHYPGTIPDANLAKAWAATLGSIPFTSKVYFMPWNEPNHDLEGGGPTAGDKAYQYSQFLINEFKNIGILDSKVIVLSPMVDKLNESFVNNSFFTNPGGKSGFYGLFRGSSINEYDQFVNGPCSASPPANNCLYNQVGIPGPFYALEAGVAGTCTPPCYNDSQLRQMLEKSWPVWGGDPNFKMFAIFSYDPHRPEEWNIFNQNQTNSFLRQIRGSGSTQSISPQSLPSSLQKCPSKNYSFYVTDESECSECGGESSLATCKPISGEQFGEEYSRRTIPLNEKATYNKNDESCLVADFQGNIDINNLKIPLAQEMNNYFLGKSGSVKDPNNPFKNAGVIKLLIATEKQDDLKLQFLDETISRGSNSKYTNFKIKGMNKPSLKSRFLEIRKKNPSGLTDSDRSFLETIWSQVPLFANEESEGEILLERNTVDKEISRVKTSVPEVYRLDKASTFLAQMLVPGFGSVNTSSVQTIPNTAQAPGSPQVLQASDEYCSITLGNQIENTKKAISGEGDLICTTLEENKLEKTRGFANDAEDSCSESAGDCSFDPAEGPSSVENRCCGNKGKCVSNGSGGFDCKEDGCNSCWRGSVTYSECCIPVAINKTKVFEDSNLNIKNKVPFLARIEKNLVGGQGLFKVFISSSLDNQNIFEDVAGESANAGIAIKNIKTTIKKGKGFSFEVNPAPANTGILFYKLGTSQIVKDFVAGKLLSLFGSGITGSTPPGVLDYTIGFRNKNITISAANKASIVRAVLSSWPASKISEKWDYVYNRAITEGWNPAFVTALWIEESGASGVPNIADTYDVGCLGGNKNDLESQLGCLFQQTSSYSGGSFEQFMCMYSEGKPAPCSFTTNPFFPKNLKSWYDELTK